MSDLSELTSAIDASNRAFEEFKKANDQRIEELKKGAGVPADLLAKLDAITKDFGEQKKLIEVMEAKMKRPQFGGDRAIAPYFFGGRELKGYVDTEAQQAHRKGFDAYIRKNRGTGGELFDLEVKAWSALLGLSENETKALSISSGPDGGFAVPKVIDAMIEATLVNISPIRALASVVQVSTPDYHKLVNIHGTASGWVGEKSARTSTTTPTLEDINPPMGEIYAFPQATQQMLDDVFFNAESWLADEITIEFARAEGAAFVNGTGIQQPKGFTTYPVAATADATRAFGTLEYTFTGTNGAFKTLTSTVNPADDLFTVVSRMKKGYRAGCAWVMNKNTLFVVMGFKDYQGRYVFNPTTAPGIDDTILGYPVTEAEDIADYTTTNALAIAFGNFKRGYLIVDRIGVRTIRDPFSNKPYVGFYTTKRLGGSIMNTETIKFLKFGTS
jgi:HK97 family phage major capsid protein